MGAVGAGWLLGFLIDRVSRDNQTEFGFDDSSYAIAQFVPLAVVGLGTWLWYWRGVVARRRADPVGEANSTIRRTFLYVTFGVALIAAIAAAAATLYGLVGSVLNAGFGGNLLSELSAPIGALVVAGIVLLYHGLALRSDQRLAAQPVSDMPATEPTVASEPAEGSAPVAGAVTPSALVASPGAVLVAIRKRAFELVGPEDELEAALLAARAALPPGVEIVDARA